MPVYLNCNCSIFKNQLRSIRPPANSPTGKITFCGHRLKLGTKTVILVSTFSFELQVTLGCTCYSIGDFLNKRGFGLWTNSLAFAPLKLPAASLVLTKRTRACALIGRNASHQEIESLRNDVFAKVERV